MRIRSIEVFLIQLIFYLILWLTNDYIAMLLSLVFGCISFFILLISIIAEMLDRSKVPAWYYGLMLASMLAPLIVGVIMTYIMGTPEWMQK